MPSRRSVLLGIAAASAGCSSLPRSGSTGTSTTEPDTTGPTENDVSFEYESAWLQRSYVGQTDTGHLGVVSSPDWQYLLVSGLPEDHARSLTAVLDGDSYTATQRLRLDTLDRPVSEAVVAVPVPVGRVDDASLELGGATADLAAGVVDRFDDPPAFEVLAFEVPSAVESDGEFEAAVRVAHRGGRRERFRATLGVASLSTPEVFEIDVQKRAVETETATLRSYASDETETAVLTWPGGRLERTLRVESETASSTTDAGGDG